MTWILAIACFFIGAAAGALLFKTLKSDEVQIRDLKLQLQQLSEEHEQYKSSVHGHFGNSARLLSQLTDSYREVYTHIAEGARSLCPDYISSQLTLNNETKGLLGKKDAASTATPGSEIKAAPLDYAAKTDPQALGTLSEEYGINKDN